MALSENVFGQRSAPMGRRYPERVDDEPEVTAETGGELNEFGMTEREMAKHEQDFYYACDTFELDDAGVPIHQDAVYDVRMNTRTQGCFHAKGEAPLRDFDVDAWLKRK